VGALLSGADSVALREMERLVGRLVATLAPLYDAPLPELERLGAGDKFDLLKIGWRLRCLGRRDMQAALRMLPMSMRDFAEDHLDGAAVRALLAGLGSPGGCPGPYAAGTVFRALHDQMASPRPLFAGPVLPQGGMGTLGEALAAAARAAGAEVRTESEVDRIEIDGGEARGVTLTAGGHTEAGVVISDADPRRTLLTLVDAAELRPEVVSAAQGIRTRAGVALVSFALDGLPDAGPDTDALAGRIQIGASLPDIERAFDVAPAGALPERPLVQLLFPTVTDAGLAEDGKQVATAWVQAVPRQVGAGNGAAGDGWDGGRETLARSVVAVIDEVLPGFSDRIVAHKVTAPPDFEERFGATNGCLFGADLSLDQALYLRPLPGWYGYRTPVRGLYLCGSGTHGGGGITGLAGRNAAQRVLADAKATAAGRSN
jgi:phytoene dehydrogenase-like protein